jgi:hypothetical protein
LRITALSEITVSGEETMTHRKTIVISFTDAGSYPGGPDFWQRARRLLKCSLRSFGLRCTDHRISELTEVSESPETNQQDGSTHAK